jgi:hypothetical protein
MSISTKKNRSTSNTNTTSTVTPTNLPGIDDKISGLAGRIGDTFANLDPYSLVPGANPLETRAADAASHLGFGGGAGGGTMFGGGVADPAVVARERELQASEAAGGYVPLRGGKTGIAGTSPLEPGAPSAPADPYAGAEGTLGRISNTGYAPGEAASIFDNGGIGRYMNPYLKDVVDTSLADYDYGAGKAEGQANLDLGQDTTYGGSGGALYKRGLTSDILRGRGTLSAGLRSDAFNAGAGLAGADADRRQGMTLANLAGRESALSRQGQAAMGLADVGTAQQGNERANIDAQSKMGEILRQIATMRAGAPIAALGAEGDLYSGLPLDLFKGSNATGSMSGTSTGKESGATLGEWLNYMGNMAKAAAAGGG